MDGSLICIILGFLFIIFSGLFNLREKLKKIPPDFHEIRYAKIAFAFTLLGAFLTGYISCESWYSQKGTDKKNAELKDSLFATQVRLERLANRQLDTALSILSLTNRLNEAQADLNHTQSKMILAQNYAYEQISGGKNKPILYPNYTTNINYYKNDSIKYTFQVTLHNVGKTYLKTVETWINDPYNGVDSINVEYDSAFTYFKGDSTINRFYSPSGNLFVDENSSIFPTILYKNVNTLPPQSFRILYKREMPINASRINLHINVGWSNGSYSAIIFGRFYNKNFYLRDIIYYQDNKKITDEVSFFGLKSITLPSVLKFCGIVAYRNVQYKIYWNEESHAIIAIKPNSIYYLMYVDLFSPNLKSAPSIFLSKLNEIFGY
jgi:hypothetical protein